MNNNNNQLKFKEHDYANLKINLREFLRNQTVLSDYDIDASVLDTIISVLAYNTNMNAITANALFAESFIGSANQRKNISMHSKHFGYTPYSVNSSKAIVDVTVVADISANPPTQLTIEKGTVFKGVSETEPLPFTTRNSYTANLVGDTYTFENVEIYQGSYSSLDIQIDKSRKSQIYEIAIPGIDTNFLEVYVQDAIDSTKYEEWLRASNSINVNGDSKVYFLQETPNGYYGIEFGDGTIGSDISDRIIVRVVYFQTKGETGNGIRSLNFSHAPNEYHKMNTNSFVTSVTTVEKATGGFERESDTSVKRNAPKYYVAQNRGVNRSDYKDLIKIKFPYINSISVWDGENGDGIYDQFGRVYISANTDKAQFLTDSQKKDIQDAVKEKYGIAGILPVIVDVDNTYLDIDTNVYVKDFVFLTSSEIENKVRDYVNTYNNDNLEQFDSTFEHSKFVAGIDDIDSVISSNLTKVTLHKRVFPETRISTSFNFTFHNQINNVTTNSFTFGDNLKTVFMKSVPSGKLNVYEVKDGKDILIKSDVGTVNFKTGDIQVSGLNIYKTNNVTKDIRFFAEPAIDNIQSMKNNICVIDGVKVTISRK